MTTKTPRRPRDANQLAKRIVDLATGEATESTLVGDGKDPAAVALGRKGGLKGGKARADAMSAEQRKAVAAGAAKARWSRDKLG